MRADGGGDAGSGGATRRSSVRDLDEATTAWQAVREARHRLATHAAGCYPPPNVRDPRRRPISSTIFIGNLSYDTTEDELRALLGEVDPRVRVRIGLDKATGRPRGFAFAEFGDDAKAADAIRKFDSVELRGRRLRVNDAADKPPPRAPRPPGPGGFAPRPSAGFGPRPGGGGGFAPRPMYSPDFPPPEVPADSDGFGGDFARAGGTPPPGGGNKKGGSRRNLRARKRSLRW